jgi:hypothetical protein
LLGALPAASSAIPSLKEGWRKNFRRTEKVPDGKGSRNEWRSVKRKVRRGKPIWLEKDLLEMVGVL